MFGVFKRCRFLACAGKDKTVNLWDLEYATLATRFEGHERAVQCLAFSPSGSHLASGGDDGIVRIWGIQGGKHESLGAHKGCVLAVAFSPDGEFLATGGRDACIILWSTKWFLYELSSTAGHLQAVTSLAFSPYGSGLVSGSEDGTVLLCVA